MRSAAICVLLGMINLPGVIDGNLVSAGGMVFCFGMGIFNIILEDAFLIKEKK